MGSCILADPSAKRANFAYPKKYHAVCACRRVPGGGGWGVIRPEIVYVRNSCMLFCERSLRPAGCKHSHFVHRIDSAIGALECKCGVRASRDAAYLPPTWRIPGSGLASAWGRCLAARYPTTVSPRHEVSPRFTSRGRPASYAPDFACQGSTTL